MAIEIPWARGSFLVGICLVWCCCPASSHVKNSNSGEGTTNIESDVASSSRTSRQLLMPAIYPYTAGLLTNYQQRPPNFFDQWLHAPSKNSSVSSDGKLFDETLPSARQQQQYPCGRGPAKPPQRTTVGIVGGSEAVPNSWPFIVALRLNGRAFCGGSLISPDKILTAAHCVEQLTSYDISRMSVSLGMHTIGDGKKTENDAQMTRRVSKVVMHNAYSVVKSIPTAHDIAILTLESPVVYSDAISPVCLDVPSNDPDLYADKDVTIIGWGRTKSDVGMSDTLQQATTKGLLSQFCDGLMPVKDFNYVFCVFGFQGTCMGDSGGPVIVQSATGTWTQAGIVSFGSSSCIGPSANTRVSAYKSWIINNT